MHTEQVIIIGAGPCGLAAAIELQAIGVQPLIIEKRNVVHSISQYPTYMHFFSTPELLEIGGIPFTTANEKPSRIEALTYYRNVALRQEVRINAYEAVAAIHPQHDGTFILESQDRYGERKEYQAKAVIVATGYFDHPNELGIPGEQSDKVTHFFREAHPYTGMKVAIIGGSNSAIDAALELERVGAKVTVVYRGALYSTSIKPWVRPIFESLVQKGRIQMRFSSRVVEIRPRSVIVESANGRDELPNDFVLALTGFHPDRAFLSSFGVTIEDEGYPTFNDETMESNVPGIYLAGVVASRHEANEIFIESGRFHGRKIAAHLEKTGALQRGQ
ncbi:YpdA family putative bacillithiol disulfide reductase [Paenibacillus montanisoli]|uniref:YpdA family putative bacillithiol disulfide reductase n=1 Tax=Paenibacillus montanisoli TaxID=2081970 RepID=A0A328UA83_9BACL|nr:YpdA family putative bacillithiol disulfide reductase [Paenibacillus montanisoli]RAP78261.1 YpdA family putative bacillithiol disulfide reductase [Paenibacillus montanisoli]